MPWGNKYKAKIIPKSKNYYVTEDGIVLSTKQWNDGMFYRELSRIKDFWGYLSVNIDGKIRKVHELVLTTWVGPCPTGMECRHLDGNKINNHIKNLIWGTRSDNTKDQIRHGTFKGGFQPGECHCRTKFNNNDVKEIILLRTLKKMSQSKIASKYGVHQSTISRILNGKRWKLFHDNMVW